MNLLSTRALNVAPSPTLVVDAKAKAMKAQGIDVIGFGAGEPDFDTPEHIRRAGIEAIENGHTRYTPASGTLELKKAVCSRIMKDYGIEYDPSQIIVSCGAKHSLFNAFMALCDDGDEVILQAPYFTPYPQQVELARGIPVELATYEEEDFQVNVERLENLITERTKALVINSPNNPTGNCLTTETMREIARIAEAYDLIVISDEIYTAYSYQHPFVPFASLPGMAERTITLNSFSKDFVMTGWRVGCIVAPQPIIRVVQQINENVVFTAPSMSQRAALYALQHREEVQPALVETFRERMFFAAACINRIPKMHVIYPPKGSFYLFINIKKTGLTSEEVAARILQEAHVLMLPGNAFGACGEGYLRMACTVDKAVIEEAFARIGRMALFGK